MRGDVLIEITKDEQGRYLFRATDQSFKPIIYHEGIGENSRQVWEAKVTKYLCKIINISETVSYGDIASRWKGDKFNALKDQFIAEGHLRTTKKGIVLNLPEEQPLTFDDPLKAESVLKYFYQERKTPLEEGQSRTWNLLSKFFTGYLSISGYLLASLMLSQQKAAMDDAGANQITADGYLSNNELAEMAKNQALRDNVLNLAESLAAQGNSHLQHQLEISHFNQMATPSFTNMKIVEFMKVINFLRVLRVIHAKLHPLKVIALNISRSRIRTI